MFGYMVKALLSNFAIEESSHMLKLFFITLAKVNNFLFCELGHKEFECFIWVSSIFTLYKWGWNIVKWLLNKEYFCT